MSPDPSSHLMNVAPRPSAVMVRGEGSYLWDDRGRRYLDFVQGWAVNALGHCPAVVQRAVVQQLGTLVSPSPAYHNAVQERLAARICDASGLSRVFFGCTGAEANEGAIKLARKWGKLHRGGASEIVTTVGGFHGRTLATMAASGKAGWESMFPPVVPGFVKVPFGDLDATRSAVTDRTVAIMVEPIQGEGGVVVPPEGYLRGLRALCDEHGLLLVLDEIQTGVGRTGRAFAHQHEGARPDVMTLGKGLGGGLPLSALVATEAASCFERGEQGGTFSANPVTAAAGLSVLDVVFEPAFLAGVVRRGEALVRGLQGLGASHGIVEVRGRGLLLAARLSTARAEAVRDVALERGLLLNAVRPDTLRLMPALNVTDAEIDELLALLAGALRDA